LRSKILLLLQQTNAHSWLCVSQDHIQYQIKDVHKLIWNQSRNFSSNSYNNGISSTIIKITFDNKSNVIKDLSNFTHGGHGLYNLCEQGCTICNRNVTLCNKSSATPCNIKEIWITTRGQVQWQLGDGSGTQSSSTTNLETNFTPKII
jgi:hypothetical protein